MTTMLETLEETADAYTHDTRAVDAGGDCTYLHGGRMCAIGRCLIEPQRFNNAADVYNLKDDHCDNGNGIDELLKPEYRGFPIGFWAALQSFHDASRNWDAGGLSPSGELRKKTIMGHFNLGAPHDNNA